MVAGGGYSWGHVLNCFLKLMFYINSKYDLDTSIATTGNNTVNSTVLFFSHYLNIYIHELYRTMQYNYLKCLTLQIHTRSLMQYRQSASISSDKFCVHFLCHTKSTVIRMAKSIPYIIKLNIPSNVVQIAID